MSGHRTTTFAAGSHVPGGNLNVIQDRAHTLDLATATDAGAPTDTQGADWITYQSPDAGIPTGDVVALDASDRDWRERLVHVQARFVTTAARRWGRADEHVGNDPSTSNVRTAFGVTGPGAVGTASAAVATGVPPVVASGSCPIPLDVRSDGEVWLFADPTTGALKLYNDTTTPLHLDLLVMATGRAPDLSAPPPDLVPTLTEILWLTPSVAASRPADPGAVIAIHRATDTGEVTLWDGGAWRSMGMVSPLTTRGDIIVRGASADQRLAVGASGRYLRSDGTDPSWAQVQAADIAGAPWSSVVPPTTVETNDATTTTLATIATIASRSYAVDLVVVSTRSPTDVVAWKLLATVHSDGGGTLTLNDVLVHGPTDGGASTMAATVDVSGTDIRVRVTGLVATVDWSVTGTVLALEN